MVNKKATPTSYAFGPRAMGSPKDAVIRLERSGLLESGNIDRVLITPTSDPGFTIVDVWPKTPVPTTDPFNIKLFNEWVVSSTGPIPARSHFAACWCGTEYFVSGGKRTDDGGATWEYLTDVWKTSDGVLWTKVCDDFSGTGAGRASHAMFYLAASTKIVICGGQKSTGYSDEIWKSVNGGVTWALSASAYGGGEGRMAYAQSATKLVTMGGYDGGARLDQVLSSVDGEVWTLEGVAPLAAGVSDAAGGFITDGVNSYFFYCCGELAGPTLTDTCYYASAADLTTWTAFTKKPFALEGSPARKGVAVTVIGQNIVIHGGTSDTDETDFTKSHKEIYVTFNLGASNWIRLSSLGDTTERAFHQIASFDGFELSMIHGYGVY